MGVYTSSPKKTAVGYGSRRWSEVRRKIVHRRYLWLWVLLALVPCYMLRQMFSSSSPHLSTTPTRPLETVVVGNMATDKHPEVNNEVAKERSGKPDKPMLREEETIPLPRAVNVFREQVEKMKKQEEKELEKKVEKHVKSHDKKTKKTSIGKSSSDNSLEQFDGDFGVPEDNEKDKEQNWQAPPAPIKKPTNVEESRR